MLWILAHVLAAANCDWMAASLVRRSQPITVPFQNGRDLPSPRVDYVYILAYVRSLSCTYEYTRHHKNV